MKRAAKRKPRRARGRGHRPHVKAMPTLRPDFFPVLAQLVAGKATDDEAEKQLRNVAINEPELFRAANFYRDMQRVIDDAGGLDRLQEARA